ncbi:MAG: hypothetical protein B7Y99_09370 [Caulobacterales bacterium 32-69-10]|nr:MAG: hypothetical protein B7Y99_09370 [Caulobacterales bacterium 32-69-10]
MHEASPESRALAGLAADLFDFALFALLGFAFVNAYAPRQDLPWKPLTIDEPMGLATTTKFERTIAEPATCLAFLREEDVSVTPVKNSSDGGFCSIQDAVQMGPQTARLAPAGPIMTCQLAAAFALWTRQTMQPAAREILGSEVVQIDHYGTYSCRRIYGQAEGRVSEHARAAAVDVAGFRLADGRRITVLDDWSKPGPEGRFLHRLRDDGCRLFRVALSPEYNAAHANHLHFDMSGYRLCR